MILQFFETVRAHPSADVPWETVTYYLTSSFVISVARDLLRFDTFTLADLIASVFNKEVIDGKRTLPHVGHFHGGTTRRDLNHRKTSSERKMFGGKRTIATVGLFCDLYPHVKKIEIEKGQTGSICNVLTLSFSVKKSRCWLYAHNRHRRRVFRTIATRTTN